MKMRLAPITELIEEDDPFLENSIAVFGNDFAKYEKQFSKWLSISEKSIKSEVVKVSSFKCQLLILAYPISKAKFNGEIYINDKIYDIKFSRNITFERVLNPNMIYNCRLELSQQIFISNLDEIGRQTRFILCNHGRVVAVGKIKL